VIKKTKTNKKRSTAHKFAVTPVKRSHLVSTSGVGSLIRLRNGATALVASLATWEDTVTLPVANSPEERRAKLEDFLRQYLIRDPELEAATGVSRFYQPPRAPSESENSRDAWQIPAVVFPRSAACENRRCGAVRHDMKDSGASPDCTICEPSRVGRKTWPYKKRQVPIFLVCPDGHISDIDWPGELGHADNCPGADMRIVTTTAVHSPKIECKACGAAARLEASRPCNGARPWILNRPSQPCTKNMHIVDRTSVQVYFPQTKSSIHVPPKSGIDPDVVDWILMNEDLRVISANNDDHVVIVRNDILAATGKDLSQEVVRRHLQHIHDRQSAAGNEPWDELGARAHELDVLTGATPSFVVPDSRFLEFHESDLSSFNPQLFGPRGVIDRVICLTRLTETRVHDGFTRYAPGDVSPQTGFDLMWGHHKRQESWLPGYRAYGEGILFVFNTDELGVWFQGSGMASLADDKDGHLTFPAILAHTLAHLMMVRLSNECGYALPSIRDRVYDLPDGRVAILAYTADSDIMGTLGGLVEFGEGQKLNDLVIGAFDDARWCSQDPVCIGREWDTKERQGACCHQCLLVPETSCEIMNRFLDRATIVGSNERHVSGIR
jgi:hypothetical protein